MGIHVQELCGSHIVIHEVIKEHCDRYVMQGYRIINVSHAVVQTEVNKPDGNPFRMDYHVIIIYDDGKIP